MFRASSAYMQEGTLAFLIDKRFHGLFMDNGLMVTEAFHQMLSFQGDAEYDTFKM